VDYSGLEILDRKLDSLSEKAMSKFNGNESRNGGKQYEARQQPREHE